MVKIGLINGGFQHAFSSTLWKSPSYFEWDKEVLHDTSFFIDQGILDHIGTQRPNKFGWVVESRIIIPSVIDGFKRHYKEISQAYKYVFTHYRELYELSDNFIYLPPHGYWIEEPGLYPKTKLVSLVSSNKLYGPGHAFRLAWVERLKDKVDVFGRNIRTMNRKEEALQDYMFSVTIENDQYETYWTEKILDCFVSGTVPVYHGAPDLKDYFNMDGVLTLTDSFDPSQLSAELYQSMMPAIKDNYERALKYSVIEDFLWENYINK